MLCSMSHPKLATPEHDIQDLISARWSPYVFAPDALEPDDLCALFEAARWSASSYNEQPWSFIVATREQPEEHGRILECLVESNQAWAAAAPVLVLCITSTNFARNGKANKAAEHDLGLATAALMLEATARGLGVHAMIGILPERARELFAIPEGQRPLTALAIGKHARSDSGASPEKLLERDRTPRARKALSDFVFSGRWGEASASVH
jgi:nitroreductase